MFFKKCKSTAFLVLSSICIASSQPKTDNHIFFTSAEIVVDVLPGNDIFYKHPFKQGISIYNLAQVFQLKADKIYAINKLNPTQPINDGRIVNIPFQPGLLISDKAKLSKNQTYIPVSYVIKKGDTAFRLCKVYFNIEPKLLMALNNKTDGNVKLGEKIRIGWMKIPSDIKKEPVIVIKKELPSTTITNLEKPKIVGSEKSDTFNQQMKKLPTIKYYESEVIGWWDKSASSAEGLFALHNDARPGSVIDIYNPMMRNRIKAKVIGKIPGDTYRDDVQIILSAAAAKDLKILDTRFMVNIKYEKATDKIDIGL